ncbi:hypothetical protein BJ170DRAFT_588186 [Xylariales sp. AK1849]|nr:hypothetical protein BJ170DRAFT_588186 [Xylariales sp. AK1849]
MVTKRIHVCPICSKQFKRSEHCARHQFSHKKERPFPCRFCGKTYARKDLVKRHEQTIHAQEYAEFVASRDAQTTSVSAGTRRAGLTSSPPVRVQFPLSRDPILPETDTQDFAAQDCPVVPSPVAATSQDGQRPRATRSKATNPSVSDANSPTSPHSTDSEIGVQQVSMGLKRPCNLISSDGDTSFNYSGPLSPDTTTIVNMRSSEITMDEIICSGNLQREPRELVSMNEQPSHLPAGAADISQVQHFTDSSNATSVAACEAGNSGEVETAKQPRNTSVRLTRIAKEESIKRHRLIIDENAYDGLLLDACSRLEGTGQAFPVKSCREMQHLINGYVDCFHRHFPILHLASLVPAETPSPLISIMCCIGAIYRLERVKARRLYQEYRLRRDCLRRPEEAGGRLWKEWVERESIKRLLCGLFIQSNLLVILYDVVPGFDINQDLDFPVLEDEHLWDVSTAEEWHKLRQMTATPSRTFQRVLLDVLSESTDEAIITEPYYISRFTALVVMHAVNVHVWHLNQVSQTLKQGMRAAGYAFNALISHTLAMLARCRDVLRHHRPESVEPSWDDTEGPLLFNCEAMLRVAYTRLFTDVSVPQKFTLLLTSRDDKLAALKRFVAAKQDRCPLMTQAVAHAFDSFFIPIRMGYLLVQKTAAFSWSVETAVSAWGCAILLCKWIHCIETLGVQGAPTEAEARLIKQVKEALEDMDNGYDEGRSLAAAVARAWAFFLNDVWVWGITARLGQNLVELSHLYESSYGEYQERQMRGPGECRVHHAS